MANDWYYTQNGQQVATPVSAAQLKQLATSGQLQPTDLVWQEGMANWMPATSIKGLFSGSRTAEQAAPMIEVPAATGKKGSRKKGGRGEEAEAPAGDEPSGLLGMNPILVFVLTLCTGGLFGLVYAYLACSAYAEQNGQRQADSTGRPLGKPRHPLGVALLSYLTFGIYFYFWAYKVISECAAYTGRKDINPAIEVSLMLVFPPYALFVTVFRLPVLIRAAQLQAKVPESTAITPNPLFLIPCLAPALPLLNMAQQDALNQLWLEA